MLKKCINREKKILFFCKSKNVLDLGCVAHEASREHSDLWLHKRILKVANSVLGIDNNKVEIAKLNKLGYNIKYGDVENLNLSKKFDVIIAGELIEHLLNPGLFIDSIKRLMDKNSLLIITTPNCFSFRRLLGSLFIKKLSENEEHVSYYSNRVLIQLFKRKGLKLVKEYYYHSNDKNKIKLLLEKFILFFLHKENCHGLFFIFKLK